MSGRNDEHNSSFSQDEVRDALNRLKERLTVILGTHSDFLVLGFLIGQDHEDIVSPTFFSTEALAKALDVPPKDIPGAMTRIRKALKQYNENEFESVTFKVVERDRK